MLAVTSGEEGGSMHDTSEVDEGVRTPSYKIKLVMRM